MFDVIARVAERVLSYEVWRKLMSLPAPVYVCCVVLLVGVVVMGVCRRG